jgi:hypothetical protein
MTVEELLRRLTNLGVTLRVDGTRLCYRAPAGVMTADLRNAIAAQRAALLARLQGAQRAAGTRPRCLSCDSRHWVDEPPRDGRIRTTCGVCGTFIGFRLVKR